jgi:hypothetical protein
MEVVSIILKGKDWDSSIPDKVILKNFKEFQRANHLGNYFELPQTMIYMG